MCLVPVNVASLPLVSSVLVSTEASRQVERAVWSKTGVHPLGQVEDLRWREGFPFALLSLQPALAATGGALVSASDEVTGEIYQFLRVWYQHNSAPPSPFLPDPSIFLGTVPAGSLLQTADEKGQGHGEDDNATNDWGQHSHSQSTVLRPGDCCWESRNDSSGSLFFPLCFDCLHVERNS